MFAELVNPDACIKSGAEKYSVKSVEVETIVVDEPIEISSAVIVTSTPDPLNGPAPKPNPDNAVTLPALNAEGVASYAVPELPW